jgi:LuxR family maltose regulon positive regulatory protein
MYVGMSELHRERNDLDAATQHLLRSKELGEFAGLPQNRYRWRVAMARIREIWTALSTCSRRQSACM